MLTNTPPENPDLAAFELEKLVEEAQEFHKIFEQGMRPQQTENPETQVMMGMMPRYKRSANEEISVVAPEDSPICQINTTRIESWIGGLSILHSHSFNLVIDSIQSSKYRNSLQVFEGTYPLDDERQIVAGAQASQLGFKAVTGYIPLTRDMYVEMRTKLQEGLTAFQI